MVQIQEDKIWTGPFIVALLNNLCLFIVYYALLTILPVYILNELHGTQSQAGLAMTMFMLSAIIVRPFSGKIIEKLGKKKTLVLSELFFCLSSILYVFIDSLTLLLLLRLFHGIWFSIVTTVLITMVNDIIPERKKGTGIGYFAMSSNIAVVIGPFVALSSIQFISYKTLFFVLAIAVVVAFLLAFTLKETKSAKVETRQKSGFSWSDLFEKKAVPIAIVGGFTAFSYASIMTFISVFAETKDLFEYVSLFFIVFAIAMIVVRPFTGKLYDTKGPNSVIYPSFVFFAVGLFLLSTMDSISSMLIAGVFIGIGYGSIIPCFQTLAIQLSERHRSGHATSTFYTIFDTGMASGAFILGLVSSIWGYTTLYILCGAIVVLTILIYSVLVSRKLMRVKTES